VKRGTIEHPKTVMLQMLLGCSRLEAVGILEALFHWAAKYARRGDIGRYPNAVIAEGLYWRGDPDALVSALIEARGEGKHGWIEEHPTMRLVVHDWHDHADESTKKTLANNGETFWNGRAPFEKKSRSGCETIASQSDTVPRVVAPEPGSSCALFENDSRNDRETIETVSPLPEPKPEPKPEPLELLGGQAPPAEPEEAVEAKPPEGRKKPPRGVSPDVAAVIDALNSLSGRRFDPGGAQAQYVRGRLRSGATVEQLVLVVEHRVALWAKDPRMRQYLRPETLFGAAKFEDYLPLAREWDNAGRPPPETRRNGQASTSGTSVRDRAQEILGSGSLRDRAQEILGA